MADIKAHEVDRYLATQKLPHCIFLIYGPDRGLVRERAEKIIKISGVERDDPFSLISLDADDAAADPSRIADEAHTVSMFAGQRVVWIKGSTQKNLAKGIDPILATPPSDCVVIIEGGDLKKSAPLRQRIEKSSHAMALPCYQDQARALDVMIDEELAASGATISPGSRNLLKSLLGADRMASRSEVQKLCLYAGPGTEIDDIMISDVVGDASALVLDTVIDCALTGDIRTMEHMFKRLIAQGVATFQIVSALQRQVQMMHVMRLKMESLRQSANTVVQGARPPIMFKRKDVVISALSRWPSANLEKCLERVEKLTLESRSNAALSNALVATALLAIAVEARRNGRN